jgi:hypothetical protein
MKNYHFKFLTILVELLIFTNVLFSQHKFDLSTGFGMPDYINIKIKYGNRVQFGAGVGTFPLKKGQSYLTAILHDQYSGYLTTWSFDFYYHFSRAKNKILFKWYWNNGISFASVDPKDSYPYYIEKVRLYYSRVGRSFYLSNRTGLNLDIGIMAAENWYTSSLNHRLGPAGGTQDHHDFSIIPVVGSISFFIKI